MRRTRSFAVAVLAVGALAVVSACGSAERADRTLNARAAPSSADLAADALEALAKAGSAHYVFDAQIDVGRTGDGTRPGFDGPITVHAEGDGSMHRGTADFKVDFGGTTLAAKVLAEQRALFVEFMGTWYGKTGVEVDPEAERQRELFTPARVREYFDDVFVGEVTEGPMVDGLQSWKFDGAINVEGLIALVEEYQGDLGETTMEQLRAFGQVTRFSFVVTKDDLLPRRYEFGIDLSRDAARAADEDPPLDSLNADFTVELSEFGKPVEFDRPPRYEPLEKLVEDIFGSWE